MIPGRFQVILVYRIRQYKSNREHFDENLTEKETKLKEVSEFWTFNIDICMQIW